MKKQADFNIYLPMTNIDDSDIINRFLDGDKEAYSLIYKKYVKELFSYGTGLGYDMETLKDVVQDLFYKILCKPKSLKDVSNLKYFLLRSLKNGLLNTSRSSVKTDSLDSYTHIFANKVTILDQLIEIEDKIQIEKYIESLLNKLTSRQKEAIYLRYIQSLDYEEIAELLDMEIPSVRNLVARGINKIRENHVKALILPHTIFLFFN